MNRETPDMLFLTEEGAEDSTKHFNDNGMRHRSGYYFCDAVEGAVAIIFSQDNIIKTCTRQNGKVVVFDHIALPPF